MTSILEGELAQTIADALTDADIPYDVTITRTVPGEPDPETPWIPGEPVVTNYACQGFTETFEADYISGGLVQANVLIARRLARELTRAPYGVIAWPGASSMLRDVTTPSSTIIE